MSSLRELFSNREYNEIIKETNNKTDGESLFYRAAALLSLGEKEKAMAIFKEHRKTLFSYNALATIKNDIKLRVELGEFDEAYDDLSEFEEYPYVSQSVEETLHSLPRFLREKEKESLVAKKEMSVEEAKKRLRNPKSDLDALSTLEAISKVAVDPFLEEIKALMQSSINDSVKTYAFLLLINCGYDGEITLNKGEKSYQMIPKNVNPPFVGPLFRDVKERLSSLSKDPSVNAVAFSLWSDYVLSLFPENPFEKDDPKTLSEAFYLLSLRYLKRDDLSSLLLERGIDEGSIEELVSRIEKALASFSPVKG